MDAFDLRVSHWITFYEFSPYDTLEHRYTVVANGAWCITTVLQYLAGAPFLPILQILQIHMHGAEAEEALLSLEDKRQADLSALAYHTYIITSAPLLTGWAACVLFFLHPLQSAFALLLLIPILPYQTWIFFPLLLTSILSIIPAQILLCLILPLWVVSFPQTNILPYVCEGLLLDLLLLTKGA